MSTATITFYKSTKISPSRNMKIDSLDTYLSTKDHITKAKVQYQKTTQLEFNVKIDVSQDYLDFKSAYDYDYCTILNSNSLKTLYYFVTKRSWKSENTVEFHVVLDTINSFSIGSTSGSADYIITKRTNVLREHKDRWIKGGTKSISFEIEQTSMITIGLLPLYAFIFKQSGIATYIPSYINFSQDVTITDIKVYDGLIDVTSMVEADDPQFVAYFVDEQGNEIENGFGWVQFQIQGRGTFIDYQWTEGGFTKVTFKVNYNEKATRKIDFQSEGLVPVLYKKEIGFLTEEFDYSWNMIYRTKKELSEEANNPVECLLLPDTSTLKADEASSSVVIDKTDLALGKYYMVSFRDGYAPNTWGSTSPFSQTVKINYTENGISKVASFDVNWETIIPSLRYDQTVLIFGLSSDGTKLMAQIFPAKWGRPFAVGNFSLGDRWYWNFWNKNCDSIEFPNITGDLPVYKFDQSGDIDNFEINYNDDLARFDAPNDLITTGATASTINMSSLDEMDRTQSTLIKIISIPYAPSDFVYDADTRNLTFASGWVINTDANNLTYYQLGNTNQRLKHRVNSLIDNPISNDCLVYLNPQTHDLRNDIYESKLFHSDFHQLKFIYDSFSFTFQYERIDLENSLLDDKFNFDFVMSTTVNSRFLFRFSDYIFKNTISDYDDVLCVARNNEKAIYNSTYLTYLRNGYNYDVKTRDRTITAQSVGLAATVVGSVVGVALGIASKNPAILVSSVVAATSGVITSSVSTANSIAQAEASLEQRKQQLQNQAASVSGSDDIDLLYEYSGNNRAKLVEYKVSDRMKKALGDLFYYTGYVCNERKIPSFNTRIYFNFVQMEIDVIETDGLTEEIVNDLESRWKNGVTIYHKYNNEYDIDQIYENWEVNLNG